MVASVGRYYGSPFKGYRGVTQGDSLSPTIFNMVVYTVIYHWVPMMDGEDTGPEGFGAVIFYAYDRLLAYLRSARLQEALDPDGPF